MATRRTVAFVAFALLLAPSACDSKKDSSDDSAPADGKPAAGDDGKGEAADAGAKPEAKSDGGEGGDGGGKGGLATSVVERVEEVRAGEEDKPVVAPGEPVIARVGTVDLPKAAFDAIYDLKVAKYTERGRTIPATAARRYRKSIIERLVWHEVLRQEVAKQRVEYDRTELGRRTEQQKRGIKDWDAHLERRGETEASLEAMYIAELREKALLEAGGKLEPSKADIEADYEKIRGNWASDDKRYRASHILVPIVAPPAASSSAPPPEPTPEELAKLEKVAKEKAEEIYKEVTAPGADFAEMARVHSTGPSAAKGGDIGIFTEDRMAEEFSSKIAAMKVGEISEPVKTKFGYHIILCTGSWPPGELPLEALEDQIRDRLSQRNLHQGRREMKEQLLSATDIVWFMNIDDGEAVPEGTPPAPELPREEGARPSRFEEKGEPMGKLEKGSGPRPKPPSKMLEPE